MRRKRAYKGGNPRSLVGFPSSSRYTLRYCDTFDITSGIAGVLGSYSYNASSINDPDTTGLGHRPMGWTQVNALYNRYIVTSSKVTVKFAVNSNGANYVSPLAVGVYISDDATVPTGVVNMVEQGRGKWNVIAAANTRGTDFRTVTNTYNPKRFFKCKDIMDNVASYGAIMTQNPSNNAYFSMWVGNLDNTSLAQTAVSMLIVIEYHIICFEQKSLAQS